MDSEIDIMFPQLKSMFPNMDDEIILQVILQNSGDYNKMIDILITFQGSEIKDENKQNTELSLFSNMGQNNEKPIPKPNQVVKDIPQKKELISNNQLAFVDEDSNNMKNEPKPFKKTIGQKVSGRFL
jgi:hypothetical protein